MTDETADNQHQTYNADREELDKFNAVADHWWNKEGEFSALHQLNPLRCDYIETQSSQGGDDIHGKSLIDIGCGGGILCEEMAARGATVTGIDLADKALEAARNHSKSQLLNINYEYSSAESAADQCTNGERERYDIVTCMEMLEHVPDPSSVVRACAELCKPGGHIFLATISRTVKAYGLMVLGAEYIMNMVPRGTHDYQKFIKPAELSSWVRGAGLELIEGSGVTYNPLNKRFRLAPNDLDVNYMLHAVKPA